MPITITNVRATKLKSAFLFQISSESPQTRDPSTQMPAAENGFSAVIVKGDLAKITNEPEPPQTATPTAREAAKDTNGRVKPKVSLESYERREVIFYYESKLLCKEIYFFHSECFYRN